MRSLDTSRRAVFCSVSGGSGTGKTCYVKGSLERWGRAGLFRRVLVFDPRGQYEEVGVSDPVSLLAAFRRNDAGVFVFPAWNQARAAFALRVAWTFGDTLLVLDEGQLYGDSARFFFPDLVAVVTEGRAFGLGVVLVAQRLALVPKMFLTNCTDFVLFRGGGALDNAAIRARIGSTVADRVAALPRMMALWIGENGGLFVP